MKNHGIRKRCIHVRDSTSQSGLFLGPGGQGTFVYTPDSQAQQQAQSPTQPPYSTSSVLASSSSSALSQSLSSFAPITSASSSSTWSTVSPTSTMSVGTSSLASFSSSANDTTTTLASTSATTMNSTTISSTTESTSSVTSSSSAIMMDTTTIISTTESASSTTTTSGSSLLATQPVAVALPSSTAAASSSTSTADPSQTESNVPIYVGIALGVIVVIAFLAALVAWSVRLHRHRRRSRNTTNVPWATRDDEKLESGTSTPDDVSFNSLHTWEPRGDRDVGEPKRSESYFLAGTPVVAARPMYATPVPPPQLPPLSHVMPLQDLMVYSHPQYPPQYPTVAHALPMMDNYGTPRQVMDRPRYVGLGEDGMGLAVPWRHSPPPPSIVTQTTPPPIVTQTTPPPVDHASPAQLPCPFPTESRIRQHYRESKERAQEEKEQYEGWAASVRSSLVSAFNAVASSLPNGHNLSFANGEAEDKLTAVPKRRLDREMSNASATSSTTLEGYRGFDHAFSLPEVANSTEQLGMTSAPLAPGRYRRQLGRSSERAASRNSTLSSASSAPWRQRSVLLYSGSVRSRISTMSEMSESEELARKLLCARLSAS